MPLLATVLPLIAILLAAITFRRGTRLCPYQRMAFLAAVALAALSGTAAVLLSDRSSPLGTLATAILWLALLYQGYRRYRLRRS